MAAPSIGGSKALPRRIQKETESMAKNPVEGISVTPFPNNGRYFKVIITGPKRSPYQGGVFKLELYCPEDYPMSPPKVRFLTKIYHPNIDQLGRICLDILKKNWSPALQIMKVCLSLQILLGDPNPDDPLDNNVAKVYQDDLKTALKTAYEKAVEFADADKQSVDKEIAEWERRIKLNMTKYSGKKT